MYWNEFEFVANKIMQSDEVRAAALTSSLMPSVRGMYDADAA